MYNIEDDKQWVEAQLKHNNVYDIKQVFYAGLNSTDNLYISKKLRLRSSEFLGVSNLKNIIKSEAVSLMEPNNCGKSTLLKLIGIISPDNRKYKFNNEKSLLIN